MTNERRKEVHMFLSSKSGLLGGTKKHRDYEEHTDLMTYNNLLTNVFGLIEDGYGEMIVLDSMRRYSDDWSTKLIRLFEADLYELQNQFELKRVEGRSTFSLDWVIDQLKELKTTSNDTSTHIDVNSNSTIENSIIHNLEWKGSKYELCELIQAIQLSKKIHENNKPINQKRILEIFSNLFPTQTLSSSSFSTNLKTGYLTNKRQMDNEFFMNDLTAVFLDHLRKLIQEDSQDN